MLVLFKFDCFVSLKLQSQKQNIDINRQAKFAATPSFALFVNLKNVVCKIGEDAEVLMSLYDPLESKFIRLVSSVCCIMYTCLSCASLDLVKESRQIGEGFWKVSLLTKL